jgi:hypothetical protein
MLPLQFAHRWQSLQFEYVEHRLHRRKFRVLQEFQDLQAKKQISKNLRFACTRYKGLRLKNQSEIQLQLTQNLAPCDGRHIV